MNKGLRVYDSLAIKCFVLRRNVLLRRSAVLELEQRKGDSAAPPLTYSMQTLIDEIECFSRSVLKTRMTMKDELLAQTGISPERQKRRLNPWAAKQAELQALIGTLRVRESLFPAPFIRADNAAFYEHDPPFSAE